MGFLISLNGGSTWTLDDSSTNVDANGNPLPMDSAVAATHIFVGDTTFKVVVDPKPTPTGRRDHLRGDQRRRPAGSGGASNTGRHWQLMMSGQATDVALAADSGTGNGAVIGAVQSVVVNNGGAGYTSTPTVVFSGGGGTGAAATAVVTNGVVTGVTITSGGSGYTSFPTISFVGGGGESQRRPRRSATPAISRSSMPRSRARASTSAPTAARSGA